MKKVSLMVLVMLLGIGLVKTPLAQAKVTTLRAGEMNGEQWSHLMAGGDDEVIVEFRQGDEIPVSLSAEGDLLETNQTGVTYLHVKKSFWISGKNNELKMSLNGQDFRPFSDVVTGSLSADAGASAPGVPVNAINLMLKMFLK